ncbi:MAG: hypothetical protein KDA41_18160 [Planctomycetales bacterium]|nr:hypothetical protein [Planctomycetales bacterium]
MSHYGSFCDDFFLNLSLHTEMELPSSREPVLHFFEQIRKSYPQMRNFYARERGEYVLEEDKDGDRYAWTAVERRRVLSGSANPASEDDALAQHALVLDVLPYALSVTPLDCESLNLTYEFDYTYRGNHNQLVAEALGMAPALEKLFETPGAALVTYEPSVQFTWSEDCRVQARLGVETRTSPYHIRTGEYPEEQFSIYLTGRRFGGLERGESFVDAMRQLNGFCRDLLESSVIDHVLRPVQQAIVIK